MAVAPETERAGHLKDYLRVLRKHRWLIMGVFLVTVITVGIWTSLQVPIYQATATILIEPEPPKVLNIQEVTPLGATPWDPNYYQTQYEIIRSRVIAERAAEALNLGNRLGLQGVAEPYGVILGSLLVEPRRNTRLVQVSFQDADPVLAADVANAVASAYAKYNLEIKLRGARDALAWLNDQMGELKKKVQESALALQNYRVKEGILGLQEQRQITAQKIMDFNKAYLDAQAQRLSIEAKLRELTQIAKDGRGAQTIFIVADSPLIQKLKSELSELEVQKSKLLKVYKEKHPEVLKVDAQIQQVNEKLAAEIQTMLRAVQTESKVARAREETLLGNVNRLRREGQDLSEKEIQYLALQRENDFNQQLYDSVVKRLKETGVAGEIETNNVKVVEQARVPDGPVKPRKTFSLVVSVVVGLVLGVGLAFVVEYFDTTVRSPDEVERYLGVPVIGIIPEFEKR